ncbi:putative FBD domain, leucine-rich repeat domain superfamily, F-box-like domain superfamily [Helianthus annuus]|nr:putative FBD domain, leucine-rich repeat domain superfamily, F-box-like domain superfamily [Helianthus annuus]
MDRISKLPVGVIETILCLLPIQEAARTSILSKEWRYHWIKIPKLVFIEDQFQEWTRGPKPSAIELRLNKPSKRKDMAKRCRFFYAIYEVLLRHEGPIHEFTLSMGVDTSCVEIDHIILHLSKKNTLKILKLDFEAGGDEGHRLPISLFSLHHLTSLYLHGCALYQQRSFNEFGCLTTLHLGSVWTYVKTLLRLLSSCPLLKRLTLDCECSVIFRSGDTTIVDLFKCLPLIEYLNVVLFIVECFAPKRLPKELPTALVHLKYLCVDRLCFMHIYGLPFLALLIRSSPNLEKLKLVMYNGNWLDEDDLGSFTLDDYSDIMLEHLEEYEIRNFSDAENELDFVRLILAKSPVLKKVTVSPYYNFDKDEEPQISEILFGSPCASPVVEIIVGRLKFN